MVQLMDLVVIGVDMAMVMEMVMGLDLLRYKLWRKYNARIRYF